MGLARKSAITASNEKQCLWIKWDGLREVVPVVKRAYQADSVGMVEVEGESYALMRSERTGELLAIHQEKIAPPKLRAPIWARFVEYFNHPFDAIQDTGEGWKTLKYPLDQGQIWKEWEAGDRLIGLGFGKTTRYHLIDIDADSPHHNEDGLRDIKWELETIGVNETILIQSSRSGGWHLYFALSRPVATFGLSCLIHQTMEAAGLIVANGELELFPNRKGWQKDAIATYNRHRLPLQPGQGSALLGNDLQPYSTDLATFLDRLDESAEANDIDLIEELAAEAKRNYNPSRRKGTTNGGSFTSHNPNARKWKRNLEAEIATGWEGPGQSNQMLRQIAEYGRIFLGYDDEYQLGEYIAQTAIAAPGFIPYCRHRREIHAWALRWAKWAMKKRWPYGTRRGGEFKELSKGGLTNEEKHAECIGRVSDAVADFEASGRKWPTTIRARRNLLARMAHCSESTLNKPAYLRLWHPNHLEISAQDGDRSTDADAVAELPSNQDTERDTAIQDNTVSHPNKYCVLSFPSPIFLLSQHVLAPCAPTTYDKPQTHTAKEIQPFMVTKNVPTPGDWLIEPDRPHILLRLESVDDGGEWCRCQDARERQRGLRGSLYFLPELIPAPMAIAESPPPEEQS